MFNNAMAYEGDGIVEPGENKADELRGAAQNPMADLIGLPLQNNTNFNYVPLDKTQNVTNIQPFIPFKIHENWLLILRTIAPLINQPEFMRGQESKFGLDNINKLPANTQVQAYYNVEKPDDLGPDWTLRLQVQFLFPK